MSSRLPTIPLIDARADPLALADPVAARALRDAAFGPLKAVVLPMLPLADRIARRWLKRSPSPYLAELDAVAARTRLAGVYAINVSYESGCTTLARADAPGPRPDAAPHARLALSRARPRRRRRPPRRPGGRFFRRDLAGRHRHAHSDGARPLRRRD
jgi:hypothetical protein